MVFFRRILGFPTEQLQRGPALQELPEQLGQQMAYLHLIHWSANPFSLRLLSPACVTVLDAPVLLSP